MTSVTIPMEQVEEIIDVLEKAGLKLCVVGSCCRELGSTEADGIEIIACEIGYALGETKDILKAVAASPVHRDSIEPGSL